MPDCTILIVGLKNKFRAPQVFRDFCLLSLGPLIICLSCVWLAAAVGGRGTSAAREAEPGPAGGAEGQGRGLRQTQRR